jgi:lipid-binding SYLF domain-containing protein
MPMTLKHFLNIAVLVILVILATSAPALCGTAAEIQRDAKIALEKLYARSPQAKELSAKAKGILVFPSIVKGGVIVGGHYGEGALF